MKKILGLLGGIVIFGGSSLYATDAKDLCQEGLFADFTKPYTVSMGFIEDLKKQEGGQKDDSVGWDQYPPLNNKYPCTVSGQACFLFMRNIWRDINWRDVGPVNDITLYPNPEAAYFSTTSISADDLSSVCYVIKNLPTTIAEIYQCQVPTAAVWTPESFNNSNMTTNNIINDTIKEVMKKLKPEFDQKHQASFVKIHGSNAMLKGEYKSFIENTPDYIKLLNGKDSDNVKLSAAEIKKIKEHTPIPEGKVRYKNHFDARFNCEIRIQPLNFPESER